MSHGNATARNAAERREGQTLDRRFYLQKWLGVGNFGAVYLAEQRVFDLALRPVALKLLHGEMVTEINAAQVLNDAVRLIQLQGEPAHAEVARYLTTVFDAGFLRDDPGQAFVAMEYVAGYPTPSGGSIRTLQGLIRAYRPVPVVLALRWMIQILRPLAWMHTLPRPVLHCDLKPDNILVCGRDLLKVADFGLAQLAFGLVGSSNAAGALTCQAPETLLGLHPTPAADVYSLGLILYELLAGSNPLLEVGREPLAAGRPEEFRQMQVQARQSGLPPLADAPHPELKNEPLLLEIVDRCLRFKAGERYDNAAALLQALERYAAGDGALVIPPSPESREEKPAAPSLDRLLGEAQALVRQGRREEARARCQEARSRFPRSARPYALLGRMLVDEGRWKEALRVCAEGVAADGADPEPLEVMALAREAGGQREAAESLRQAALGVGRR
jgi:serine/threonine protein kinase